MLKPKILTTLKDYKLTTFFADLNAGIIVGIVALPLAIAFAIASGVSPEKGLITAIIAGFIISALGGSRVQIGGPTGAFIVIVYDILLKYGYDGLLISTVMAGVILVIMGFARLGSIIKFIPFPIVVGFTSGIAVIIFTAQINDLLGFGILKPPGDFIPKIIQYIEMIANINQMSIIISAVTLAIIILWNKLKFKIPGSLIAILVTTAIVYFMNLPIETIGSRFGDIPSTIPAPSLPAFDLAKIKDLILPATTIAILAAIESLLSAVVADGMIGGKHRSNIELIAQGAANIITPFFGGIPATGAIARTMTNIKSGGKTPVAGIIHSFVLLLIMLVFAQFAKLIPLATLAAVLMTVAYNMFEWKEFQRLSKSPRSDALVLLTTFLLTIIFDLTVAIEIGMLMAAFLFMRKMALVTNIGVITRELNDTEDNPDEFSIDNKLIPNGVEVYEINGPFFFGAATKFKETVERLGKSPKIQIIRMRNVPAIDYTGIHFLEEFYKDSLKKGIKVIFSGMHAQPYKVLEQTGFLKDINDKDICGNIDIALARAQELLNNTND